MFKQSTQTNFPKQQEIIKIQKSKKKKENIYFLFSHGGTIDPIESRASSPTTPTWLCYVLLYSVVLSSLSLCLSLLSCFGSCMIVSRSIHLIFFLISLHSIPPPTPAFPFFFSEIKIAEWILWLQKFEF
ncbi:hypothetical protein QQ045_004321 [Rhodiola kirilowii]